jgi:dolichyl-phosphate-mannose--protein O-mannosyl transferase
MANPILLWFSTAALAVGLLAWLSGFCSPGPCPAPKEISLYLGINYLVNLLPWLKISRCTFFYHYMPAYLFSWLALALILNRLLHQTKILPRAVAISILALIILGFYYWLPLFLGLPLTPQSFARRMLLRSWI